MYASDDLGIEALMQEPPGGGNHGRSAGDEGWSSLSVEEVQAEEFMQDGSGFTVVETSRGRNGIRGTTYGSGDAGMTTHRGVTAPTEYIDTDRVLALVEKHFGVSLAEINAAFQNGRPTAQRARSRARIDAQLLALSRSGGNLTALARVLGWEVEGNGTCRRIDRALERARAAEAVAR